MHSSAQLLKLITFDADGTLYADGAHIEHDNEMIRHIIALMRRCAERRQRQQKLWAHGSQLVAAVL